MHGASITVNSTCSLSDAVTAANSDTATGGCAAGSGADTITLSADITLSAATPGIQSEITINGGGFTIDGDDTYRIFAVQRSGNLTVNRLTMTNGYGGEDGEAILNYYGTLTVTNSTFSHNSAIDGGAIESYGTTSVANSIFSNNAARSTGGAIYHSGHTAATVTITTSTFRNNSASWAGAVGFSARSANATITNSTFSSNTATWGGAVRAGGLDSVVTVTNNTFSGNTTTDRQSGAISTDGSPSLSFYLRNNISAGNTGADCSGNIDQNIANLF